MFQAIGLFQARFLTFTNKMQKTNFPLYISHHSYFYFLCYLLAQQPILHHCRDDATATQILLLLKFHTPVLLTVSIKGCCRTFLFCLDLELLINLISVSVKNPGLLYFG